jgi:hypothetical protein
MLCRLIFWMILGPILIATAFSLCLLVVGLAESFTESRWSYSPPSIPVETATPAPTPEVRRAERVMRGTDGRILPLPPTLPNGNFDLNAGM